MSTIDDRRVDTTNLDPIDDRRIAPRPRRKSPRMRTLKGAQIVWPTGHPIPCLVRNLSETGACIEVHSPVPHNIFDLIFDSNQARYACSVVWRQPPKMGVKFL